MELCHDGENRKSSKGHHTKGIERVKDGVDGRQVRENEKIDGVEVRQAKVIEKMEDEVKRGQVWGVETKKAGLEGRWRRIRRSQWCAHVLANKTYLFVSWGNPQPRFNPPHSQNGTMAKDAW